MTDLIRVDGLTKTFPVRSGLFARRAVSAVDNVSLTIGRQEIVGLVGESGSGKSTLARCLLGLTSPDAGTIAIDGADITSRKGAAGAEFRRRVQPVFQDPYGSLDPRWTVARTIRESLDAHRTGSRSDRDNRVVELLGHVGLRPEHADRYPDSLSGGQRQRVGIAAALASNPDLIIADEPVSALDVSVQAQVLNLFADLRSQLGVSILFISHDLAVVEHLCQRVAVMYLGRIVEEAETAELFRNPRHPYTQALLASIPRPEPHHGADAAAAPGEIPSPLHPPDGCRFHPRCPFVQPICSSMTPAITNVSATHRVSCWRENDFRPSPSTPPDND